MAVNPVAVGVISPAVNFTVAVPEREEGDDPPVDLEQIPVPIPSEVTRQSIVSVSVQIDEPVHSEPVVPGRVTTRTRKLTSRIVITPGKAVAPVAKALAAVGTVQGDVFPTSRISDGRDSIINSHSTLSGMLDVFHAEDLAVPVAAVVTEVSPVVS